MENASRALIIAGGILIAMIVISVFYLMFNNLGSAVGTMEHDTYEKEVEDFNKRVWSL